MLKISIFPNATFDMAGSRSMCTQYRREDPVLNPPQIQLGIVGSLLIMTSYIMTPITITDIQMR